MQVLINFTMGLVGALVAFLWQVWGLISSYQVPRHHPSHSQAPPRPRPRLRSERTELPCADTQSVMPDKLPPRPQTSRARSQPRVVQPGVGRAGRADRLPPSPGLGRSAAADGGPRDPATRTD